MSPVDLLVAAIADAVAERLRPLTQPVAVERRALLTLTEAADELRIGARTLDAMRAHGEIRVEFVGGENPRVPRSEIERIAAGKRLLKGRKS